MNILSKVTRFTCSSLALILVSNHANAWSILCHENETVEGLFFSVGHSAFVTETESNTYGYFGLDATLYWTDEFGPNDQYYGWWGTPYLPDVEEDGYSGGAGIDFTTGGGWEFASEWRARAALANYAGQVLWGTLLTCSAYYG